MLNKTNRILGWGLLAGALFMLLRRTWLMELDSFEFDDAFMYIRYAENILAGGGYTWNMGDPAMFGNTSILYTYIIGLTKSLFGSFMTNSQVLVTTALIFALAFLVHFPVNLRRQMQSAVLSDELLICLVTIPFLVFPLIFGFHISTGMETTLSLFLHSIFLFAVMKYGGSWERRFGALAAALIAGYLLFLVRPDNALVVAGFPALYFAFRRAWKHLLFFGLALTAVIALDSIIKYLWFGDILPLSYYTKRSGFTEGYTAKYFWNPIKYLTQIAAYTMPFILAIFAFARRRHVLLLTAFMLPVAATYAYYFSFDQIMGFNARLYFPFVPYIIVPALILADEFFSLDREEKASHFQLDRSVFKLIALSVFLILAVYSKYRFINMYENYAIAAGNKNAIVIPGLEDRKYDRELSIRLISDLLKEFPDDFVFAATEHGYISGDNPDKRIFDLSGLHNYTIAQSGYSDDLLREEQPDLVWMPHQDLTVLHHAVRTGDYFQSAYEYIPNIYAFGCAIRKDSPHYEKLRSLIQ